VPAPNRPPLDWVLRFFKEQEVRGIRVRRKADALFFLHTARTDARRDRREVQEKKQCEMPR